MWFCKSVIFVIVRVYSWHLQKCEATPDVECWSVELSWRAPLTDAPGHILKDNPAILECFESVNITQWIPSQFISTWRRWASSPRPLRWTLQDLLMPPSIQTPSQLLQLCSRGPCLDRGHAGVSILVHTCKLDGLKDIAHSLDNKADPLSLGTPPPPHSLYLTGHLFLHFLLGELASSLPFGGVRNISQTRCWSVLVISVVGLNPRWENFQMDLKCATRVKFDVFLVFFLSLWAKYLTGNHPEIETTWAHFCIRIWFSSGKRGRKRRNGATDCSRWRQWMHTDPRPWFIDSA